MPQTAEMFLSCWISAAFDSTDREIFYKHENTFVLDKQG